MGHDPKAASEIFYDGACPVCRREIALYRKLPGLENATWTDASVPDAALGPLTRAKALSRFHIRRRDGALASGFAAFLAIWRGSPRLRPVAVVLDRQPFLFLGETAYRLFLKLRPLWRRA